jgi:hypothetical protein
MSATVSPVSDMLVTVKSREVQRAMFAESAGDRDAARRHFLAAAHLQLGLAHDYDDAGQQDLGLRSRISAASCLWSAGDIERGRQALEALQREDHARTGAIASVIADLARNYPPDRN